MVVPKIVVQCIHVSSLILLQASLTSITCRAIDSLTFPVLWQYADNPLVERDELCMGRKGESQYVTLMKLVLGKNLGPSRTSVSCQF